METTKQNTPRGFSSSLAATLQWGIGGIFVIAPFYAPLTVLLASHFSHFDFLRIWKELALTGLGIIMFFFLVTHWKKSAQIIKDRLFLCILAYSAILIIVALYDLFSHRVDNRAVIYGLLINLRLVGYLGVVLVAFRIGNLYKSFPWKKLILIPALVVIVFGFLQLTVLPKNILSHIGYSKKTIVPYQTVDNRPDFARVQSTLRGPNTLGAYLIVILSIVISLMQRAQKRVRIYGAIFILLGLVVLYGTYSRSAWAGMFMSLIVLLIVYERRFVGKKSLLILAVILATMAISFPFIRSNYQLQNILFHSSNRSTASISSNAQRASALKLGAKDIWHKPFGTGLGSAGPASLRNTKGPSRIAENYFLQVGQEVGILGLGFFLAIQILLLERLWQRKDDPLARALLASLVGLIFVNMVSHAWSDDTLAYTWWGLAGIALSPVILSSRHKQNGKISKIAATGSS